MITIDLLKYHPDAIQRLAEIGYEVLGQVWLPEVPVERIKQSCLNHLNDDCLPLTFVAFQDGQPVGMCSLRENDGIRSDLKPWLAALVIDSAYQRKGIGKLLIETTKEKARNLGFGKLYLFVFDPKISDYYARLGWKKIGMDEFKGIPVTVMEIVL